jgi:glutathione S-transferase
MTSYLQIISYDICPFAQRVIMFLEEISQDYSIEYIDISNKPDWFVELSPLGKVPILRIGDEVLFESNVMLDYLNDIFKSKFYPMDDLVKAKQKALIEFSSNVLKTQWEMLVSVTNEDAKNQYDLLIQQLTYLEMQVKQQPYFNGSMISMVDIAFAPLLQRLIFIECQYIDSLLNDFPNLRLWSNNLLLSSSLSRSSKPNISNLITMKINSMHSVWSK